MQVQPIRALPDERDLSRLADHFETRPTEELLAWAVERFGEGLTQACSFGLEDVALVDLRARVDPAPDIFWLNTGFLFPETLETRDRLAARYRISFREILPTLDVAEQTKVFGDEFFHRAPASGTASRSCGSRTQWRRSSRSSPVSVFSRTWTDDGGRARERRGRAGVLNRLLAKALASEGRWLERADLPFGTWLFALARRPG